MSTLRDGVIRRGGSWSYVIRVTDAAGVSKPRWVGGFRTEADAKAARDAARVAARRGEYVDRNRITVEQYLAQWLEAHALEVKPKTHHDYKALIRSYVAPRIGRMQLQSVRPTTLSSLYRTLLAEGGRNGQPLSPRTVGYVHAVLRKAFNDAVRTDQILTSNPAERAKRPKTDAVVQVTRSGTRRSCACSSTRSRPTGSQRSSVWPPTPAPVEASCCTCGGTTSSSAATTRTSSSGAR
jgi:hypothetical protein